MKIKTQFIICLVVFSVIFLIIGASVVSTEQQVAQLTSQEEISNSIERGASSLNSVSIDYFLYQEDLQLSQWQSTLSSLSSDLSALKLDTANEQNFSNNVAGDLQRLNNLFGDVVSYLQSAPRNVSIRIDPAFQIRWSSMAVESKTLAFDASQLSRSLDDQAHKANNTNILLIVSLVGTFGAFLAVIYLIVFRRTLKSVEELQNGINTVSSGNLEFVIETKREDEISELSQSFNQMTANLKTVTASKTDLEKEISGRKHAETLLRDSEQRWATTLASIGDAVIATDLLGRIMFMNGVAEELTGWTLNDALQRPVKEIFNIINEQTRFEVENPVCQVLEKGLIVALASHTVLIKKDGTEVAIDDSGAPIKNKEGKTSGVVLIFRDITERKKSEESLRESEQRLRFHAENIPLGVVEWDNNFVVTRWAGDAEKIFGWKSSETIGRRIMDLRMIYEPDIPIVEKTMSRLASGETKVVTSNRNITKDGQVIYCTWYNSVLLDDKGKMVSVFSFVEDGTTRVNAEKVIEANNRNLEKLIEERTKQLKDSERLAAIGATAGMVGHDIRNPLQAITSDVYLAKTDLSSLPDSEEKKNVQESLAEIEKNIYYINKIVADLQDFAKPLTPKIEEINLEQTLHAVIANLSIPGNITMKHSIKRDFPKLKTDQSYIQRILTNLVNNAIQAMPKGGKLTVNAVTKNGKALISVEDNGEGIPENVRSKIFMPLVTTKSKGQGFGLSVVKRFTEALGGTVAFESEIGKGTKFTIELPIHG
jgi:PAS domain S-box-containing protein